MDLVKSYDFFKPETCGDRIHIIGCGAVGSTVAETLVRFGLTNITLYDFDTVEAHNIANQMFRTIDIGKPKTQALAEILTEINPELEGKMRIEAEGYHGQRLSGYVFLCVDNIDLRREIATANKGNPYIKAMFDFRIRLEDAQHYAADWHNPKMVNNFLATMQFSHEEAKKETQVSACNVELSVAPTVRQICALGVSNFINFVKSGGAAIKKMILASAFDFDIQAF